MGLNMPNLFSQNNLYDDQGRILTDVGFGGAGDKFTFASGNQTQVNAGTGTMYTVPAGKIFYLTNITVSAATHDTSSYRAWYVTAGGKTIIYSNLTGAVAGTVSPHEIVCQQYNPPIKLTAAQTVTITRSGAGLVSGALTGWLEDA